MARWARFRTLEGHVGFGTVEEDIILEYEGDMFQNPIFTGREITHNAYSLLVPCVPTKVVALWNNFRALAARLGKQPPAHPLFFLKSCSSLAGMHEPIERPPGYAGKIVFEAELGIVIGRICRGVSSSAAPDHIFGYTCVNDITAIDLLSENPDFAQWARSKSFDTFGCLGPVITTDFDWAGGRVMARLDGSERQNYLLADMIFDPHDLVSRISQDLTLVPGDVIACGTSLGVGSIKKNMIVEIEIPGIGVLSNRLAG